MRGLRTAALTAVCGLALAGCGPVHKVSGKGMKAYEVALAVDGDKALLAWHGGMGGHDSIWLQTLTVDGKAAGEPRRVTDGASDAYDPDLKWLGGRPVLAWYEKTASGGHEAWLAAAGDDGRPVWRRRLNAGGGAARNPVIEVHEGQVYAAWIETAADGSVSVWSQRFNGAGEPLDAPEKTGQAGDDTWNLNAAVDARGVLYVVWDARAGAAAKELQLAVVDGETVRQHALTPNDGKPSVYPDLKITPKGQAALTWLDMRDGNEEVYLAVLPLPDLASGAMPVGRRITHTDTPSIGAYLAWNGDQLGLIWCDPDTGRSEIYGQRFDVQGRPLSKIERLTDTPGESSVPSMQPSGKGFLIAWNDYTSEGSRQEQGRIKSSIALTRRFDPQP